MSIVWWDGFDTYGNDADDSDAVTLDNVAKKYIEVGNNRCKIRKVNSPFLTPEYYAQTDGIGTGPGWVDFLTADLQISGGTRTLIFSAWYRSYGPNEGGYECVDILDDAGNRVAALYSDTSEFKMKGGLGGTASLVVNRWYRIEWYFHLDDASGTDTGTPGRVIFRADDGNGFITYIDWTGNTKTLEAGHNNRLDRVKFGASRGHVNGWDDVVVIDADDGIAPTSFVGNLRIFTKMPDGNGKANAWSVSGAGSNYQAVDDREPDDLASYVSTPTNGAEDWYTVEDLGFDPDYVLGIGVTSIMKDSAAGTRGAAVGIDSGGNEGFSLTQNSTSNWKAIRGFWETEPVTDAAWTQAKVDALQIANKRIS